MLQGDWVGGGDRKLVIDIITPTGREASKEHASASEQMSTIFASHAQLSA
jgi:hypothetical protein